MEKLAVRLNIAVRHQFKLSSTLIKDLAHEVFDSESDFLNHEIDQRILKHPSPDELVLKISDNILATVVSDYPRTTDQQLLRICYLMSKEAITKKLMLETKHVIFYCMARSETQW